MEAENKERVSRISLSLSSLVSLSKPAVLSPSVWSWILFSFANPFWFLDTVCARVLKMSATWMTSSGPKGLSFGRKHYLTQEGQNLFGLCICKFQGRLIISAKLLWDLREVLFQLFAGLDLPFFLHLTQTWQSVQFRDGDLLCFLRDTPGPDDGAHLGQAIHGEAEPGILWFIRRFPSVENCFN